MELIGLLATDIMFIIQKAFPLISFRHTTAFCLSVYLSLSLSVGGVSVVSLIECIEWLASACVYICSCYRVVWLLAIHIM